MSKQLKELLGLSLSDPMRALRNWWLRQVEDHYLMCAEVEDRRAREHLANVGHYQKRAALARAARNS